MNAEYDSDRKNTFLASAKFAIQQDTDKMKVPGELAFSEVVSDLTSQLILYKSMLKTIDPKIITHFEFQNIAELKPILLICELIARERPELAFQAGRLYERMLYSGQSLFDF